MSETTTTTVAEPKATQAAKVKKAPAAKKVTKSTNGKYVMPDQVNKEIRWTPAKIALLTALSKSNAKSVNTAISVEEIAKASKGALQENQVQHQVNPLFDLSAQDIIRRVKHEGQASSQYFVTAKGLKALAKNS